MTSRGDVDPPVSGTHTTHSSAPRTPQTPTTTPPDLPDPPSETPKMPRGLVADLRVHISHAQATERKLSEAAYKDCFALLDALSSSLDDKDTLSLSLDAFKVNLLSQIQTTLSHAYSAPTYSAAAAAAAAAAPARTSPRKHRPRHLHPLPNAASS
ncbi:hypothetical protein K438DRAFT_1773319 [Mycena galopus ATCC 62051]|nr:hypothetical protein K438DRAFT_1773319 [Mycena galopus ATCC 62051]